MSGEWFAELTEAGRPIFIDGYQVKTADVTRQADGSLSVAFGKQGSVVMASPELVLEWVAAVNTLTAQRDRARDVAARLEGEVARVRDVVTAWSLGETSRDEMVLWAIREIVGLTPARPETPTPWPHFDTEVAP